MDILGRVAALGDGGHRQGQVDPFLAGAELPGEPTVTMKVQRLLSADRSQLSDLRVATPIVPRQR